MLMDSSSCRKLIDGPPAATDAEVLVAVVRPTAAPEEAGREKPIVEEAGTLEPGKPKPETVAAGLPRVRVGVVDAIVPPPQLTVEVPKPKPTDVALEAVTLKPGVAADIEGGALKLIPVPVVVTVMVPKFIPVAAAAVVVAGAPKLSPAAVTAGMPKLIPVAAVTVVAAGIP